jgi:hypothetical protein
MRLLYRVTKRRWYVFPKGCAFHQISIGGPEQTIASVLKARRGPTIHAFTAPWHRPMVSPTRILK